tara:strand:- start:212 stop:460 length:249 start_codon:yes stop_codon:yes gene_type:complete
MVNKMGVYGLGRPADPNVKHFQRKLGPAERATLLAAGDGDMSAGFLEVIDTYQFFYNLGLRPSTARDAISLTILATDVDIAL